MFGHFHRSLDDKKRIVLPAKFRKELGDVVFATFGPDRILELRSADEFEKMREKLMSNNMLNKNLRKFVRTIFGNTIELKVDKLGRINLPDHFILKATISKEVSFVGVGNKVELWDKQSYVDFQNEIEEDGSIDELANSLFESGVEL
ncbi:division/cell wall cluster transcriptional repressor MraZ [Mycoplasma marinum]|uniref:Transcriptional regulator MraZ n=1 Tax=Mycoplasma marinum TaxID=1937190 RepID=A0A4R0XVI9_9MOLU|nr:division/cell wall cluster transcriptional repressor MraZ [Mycoplasma marinum]TCG11772.1 cell division/cell wall cluster transcriptional repressor MraZ [Mycoplasma marinum]